MRLRNRLLASGAAVLFLGLIAGAAQATSTGGFPGSGAWCDHSREDVQSGPLGFSHFCFDSLAGGVDPGEPRLGFFDGQDGCGPLHGLEEHGDLWGRTLAFFENAGWGEDGSCLGDFGWGGLCNGPFPFPFDEGSFDPHEGFEGFDWLEWGWIKLQEGGETEFAPGKGRFNVVPEPASAALLGLGLLGLAVSGRRR